MTEARTRETILVADDEPRNRALVVAYLGSAYRVLEAGTGVDALDVVAREPVDLVLLDIMLPGMSGYDVCRQLKAGNSAVFLPVLLVTALSDQEDRNTGLAAGADDFLTKPVNRAELLLRCRAFLSIRRQEKLIRRQLEDLRRAQSLKDDLVALIIHDLRNPLLGIDGNIALLERWLRSDGGDERVRSALGRLSKSATQLREIADSVLDVRLLEEGELKLRPERIPLAELVSEAIVTVSGAADVLQRPIVSSVGPRMEVLADRKLVRRALENLLSNALKYGPVGASIDVMAEGAGEGVALEVADRGPGVPDELKRTVFEKFGSVEATRGITRRGYGLGLHLVELVASAHGGTCRVLDRPGGGSIFRLELPARIPHGTER
jgi:signal transduction histidine kinase